MGFSVSTSFAVIALGTLAALGGVYAATTNGVERVQDATQAQQERIGTVHETAINISTADLLDLGLTGCGVELAVNNTGRTELSVNDTDLLVDGRYQTGWEDDATVDGDADTDVWLPGEQLSVNVTSGLADDRPDRVKVVTGSGVAASRPVTGGILC